MKNRRKQRRSRVRPVRGAVFVALCIFLVLGVGMAYGAQTLIERWLTDLPDVQETKAFSFAQKSVVYASDETTVLAEFQVENREPLDSLKQISPYVLTGTVATEDSRFYEHNGVDLTGVLRALVNNVLGGSLEGASTITQQLVRNTLISDEMSEISLKRKVREAELALRLEQTYTKDEILLMYLNTINYGDGCYGIEAAAQHYFQVHASDLTLVQAATLVGIPQSPTAYNPVNYPDACQLRRNTVLSRMLSAGAISQDEYKAAVAEDLVLNVEEDSGVNGIYLYPYFTSYVRDQLLENFSMAEVFEGGMKIYTTIDISMQEMAETACDAQNARMSSALECSLVALDPSTGYIKAMVGGKDFYEDQYNTATGKGRPTGSSFKTFTLVTALEQGISPSTTVDCSSPVTVEDGTQIENFNNINYGTRTIQSATAVSANTGYVRLQKEVGAKNVIETARKMGVTADNLPEVNTLTLGVADVNTLDMASAYGVLAADGKYYEPKCYYKIVDMDGNVIYDAKTADTGTQVISGEVAYAATNVLKTVFTEGTATSAQLSTEASYAGKSGTTENFQDHWLVGYTPYLSCATWIGDRYNNSADSSLNCNQLWKEFMDMATKDKKAQDFTKHSDPPYNHTFSSTWNKSSYALNASSSPSSGTGTTGTGTNAGTGTAGTGGTGTVTDAGTANGGAGGDAGNAGDAGNTGASP